MIRLRLPVAGRLMLLMAGLATVVTGLALVLEHRALREDLDDGAVAHLSRAARGSTFLLVDHLRARARHHAAVARTPELRANLDTGHPATLRHHAQRLAEREGAQVVAFVRPNGQLVASAGDADVLALALAAVGLADVAGSRGPETARRACVSTRELSLQDRSEAAQVACEPGSGARAVLTGTAEAPRVAIAIPLLTRGRALGSLLVVEALPRETLAIWSQLTGASLVLVAPGAVAGGALEQVVHTASAFEVRARYSQTNERATLARSRRNLLGAGLAALLLAVLSSTIVARSFVRPIRSIQRAAERAAQGDLGVRIASERTDEIGDVARGFDLMLERLGEGQERVRLAQRLAQFGDWALEADGRVVGSEEAWRIFGLGADGEIGVSDLLARMHPDDRDVFGRALAQCRTGGRPFRLELRTQATEDVAARVLAIQAQRVGSATVGSLPTGSSDNSRVEASVQDVTEARAVEDQIRYLAYHDSLTGLGNRRLIEERLGLAIAEAYRRRAPLAVLFVNLDRFKAINDTLGHPAGDLLLQEVASRLVRELPNISEASDTNDANDGEAAAPALVVRPGGDEFIVLLPACADEERAKQVGRALLAKVAEPVVVENDEVVITASVGIAIWPDDGQDVTTLLRSGDTAAHHAKAMGSEQLQLYADSMRELAHRRLRIETRLRQALEQRALEVVYQPRVDPGSTRILGFEALTRWRDPELGVVPPSDFVPVAEETGLVPELGRFVLERAAEQTRLWHEMGFADIHVSVNLSPYQIRPEFLQEFDEVVERTGVDPKQLELEVTESALLAPGSAAVLVLQGLRARGASVALDDFGTGYSSFAALRQLPIDALKVDRAFVEPIAEDEEAASLVAAILSMGRVLRLRVVVEGVEDEAQHELLQEMGCDEIQGYLFGEPASAEEATRRLEARQPVRRKRRAQRKGGAA